MAARQATIPAPVHLDTIDKLKNSSIFVNPENTVIEKKT
jgi:hypothetical protein